MSGQTHHFQLWIDGRHVSDYKSMEVAEAAAKTHMKANPNSSFFEIFEIKQRMKYYKS